MRNLFSILIVTGLTACGPAQNDPGWPSNLLLDEQAAEMLDERNAPPESIENQKVEPGPAE